MKIEKVFRKKSIRYSAYEESKYFSIEFTYLSHRGDSQFPIIGIHNIFGMHEISRY